MYIYSKVRSLLVAKKGQGLVEYGLILAGVAVVAVVVFGLLSGSTISDKFSALVTNIGGKLGEAATAVASPKP